MGWKRRQGRKEGCERKDGNGTVRRVQLVEVVVLYTVLTKPIIFGTVVHKAGPHSTEEYYQFIPSSEPTSHSHPL